MAQEPGGETPSKPSTGEEMPYIDRLQVGGTDYEIHDFRVTGGALDFRGILDNVTDKTTVTQTASPAYEEGDVVMTTGGKEFVVVNLTATAAKS